MQARHSIWTFSSKQHAPIVPGTLGDLGLQLAQLGMAAFAPRELGV